MLRFYMDHHVHSAITLGLRKRGIDCLTLREDRADRMDDQEVLRRATLLGRILVTQDEDFLTISARGLTAAEPFSGIVFSDQLGVTVGQAVRDLEIIAHAATPEELRNTVLRIPM